MKVEFKEFKLKPDRVSKHIKVNSFIVVGEEIVDGYGDCYKVHEIDERGLVLFADLKIDEIALTRLKSDFEDLGSVFNIFEFDIPKKHLDIDI